jgi:hypothetical protein
MLGKTQEASRQATKKYGSKTTELSTTMDQWKEALSATVKSAHPEGKTLAELVCQLGLPRSTIRGRLANAIKLNTCKSYKDYRNNRPATVYVLEN